MNCKKFPLDRAALEEKLPAFSTVWVTKGRKLLQLHPVEDKEEILSTAIGRSGNLRAPSLRLGDALVVGFSEAAYARLFDPNG